jgi:hypothetical protein
MKHNRSSITKHYLAWELKLHYNLHKQLI